MKGGEGPTTYEYYQDVIFEICVGPIKRIRRLWFDRDVTYDDRPERPGWGGRPMTSDGRRPALASYLKLENVFVGLGTQTQDRWPVYEAAVGTDNCPAMRGRAIVAFKDLPVHKFGGRLPTVEAEVESDDADGDGKSTLIYVLNKVCDLAEFPGSSFRDFTELTGILVDGYQLASRAEARQHLDPLQSCYFFDFLDADWKLRAKLRGSASIGTIDPKHMGMGTPDPQETPYVLTRGQQLEKPQRADVSYQSAAIDYQTFTQQTTRAATLARKTDNIQLPVVMGENQAMATARKRLALGQLNDAMKQTLPVDYLAWMPGDNVNIPLEDGSEPLFRITRKLTGLFGHIEFDLVPENLSIYTLTGDGATPPSTGDSGVTDSFAPVIYAADLNAIVNQDDASFDGCSLIIVIGSIKTAWTGAHAKCQAGIRQFPGGEYQTDLTTHTRSGTIGNLTSTLGKWRGENVWDNVNTITLVLANSYAAGGDPESTNTGNGILSMADPSTSGGVLPGLYVVAFTDATHYTVTDPNGATVGTGTTGSNFGTEIRFKIDGGSTDFIAGDTFNITVVASTTPVGTPPVGATDLQVMDGANALVCEGEIIQFASALDLGGNTYQLSRLLRGRRGTEHIAWNDHSAGARLAFLPSNSVPQRFKAMLSEVGNTRRIEAFENDTTGSFFGLGYGSVPFTDVTLAGNCRKPWSPGQVGLARAVNDLVITWVYRSRWGDELGDGGTGTVRLGEDTEKYDIEVWDSTFATLKRTTTGLTAPTWTYTSAMQATDWGVTPKTPLGLVIYQTSVLVGRGFPKRVVVSI